MQPQFPKPEPTTRWLTQELQGLKSLTYVTAVIALLNLLMLLYDTDVIYHIDQLVKVV